MAGQLDQSLHVGVESTYGTFVTPTRSLEVRESSMSSHSVDYAYLTSMGVRSGYQGVRSDRTRNYALGGTDTITTDVFNEGMGFWLRAMMGTSSIVQEGATLAWTQSHDSDSNGPCGESLTIVKGIPPTPCSAAVEPMSFLGCKVTNWTFSQSVGDGEGGNLQLEMGIDYATSRHTDALPSDAYPTPDWVFGWTDLVCSINSVNTDILDMSFSGDNALDVDRRLMRAAAPTKKEPERTGIPTYEGSITAEFEDMTLHDLYTAGTAVPIVFTWTGNQIDPLPHNATLTITLTACELTAGTPTGGFGNVSRQPLNFVVRHDGTNPMVQIDYKSTDTAI